MFEGLLQPLHLLVIFRNCSACLRTQEAPRTGQRNRRGYPRFQVGYEGRRCLRAPRDQRSRFEPSMNLFRSQAGTAPCSCQPKTPRVGKVLLLRGSALLRRYTISITRAVGMLSVLVVGLATNSGASATLLLEEPYGKLGFFTATGHSAVYLSGVCAESPV